MAMIQIGADVPITLTNIPTNMVIQRIDFSQYDKNIVTKTGDDVTFVGTYGYLELTQEETLKFSPKSLVKIQIAYLVSGKARRSNIRTIYVKPCLYERSI